MGNCVRDLILGEGGTGDTLRQLPNELVLFADFFASNTVSAFRYMSLVTDSSTVISLADDVSSVFGQGWLGSAFMPMKKSLLTSQTIFILRIGIGEDNLALLIICGNDFMFLWLGPLIELDQIGGTSLLRIVTKCK